MVLLVRLFHYSDLEHRINTLTRRRRNKHRDDDFDEYKWPPLAVKHDKHRNGNTPLDEPTAMPTPFDAYQYHAVGNSQAPATPGLQHADLPPGAAYPNPWGSTPPTTEAAGRSASASLPAAPTSEGSVYSGTALSASDPSAARPLHVRNPTPGISIPMADVKDRTVFLSADRGMQIFGGQNEASGSAPATYPPATRVAPGQAGSSSSGSASSAPFQHQDAGAVPVHQPQPQSQPQPSQPQRPQKAAEASTGASSDPGDAPPAYEA